jgi:plastocyanin
MRLRTRGLGALLVPAAMGLVAYGTLAGAQQSVRGTVRIQERGGAVSRDLANAVVYLVAESESRPAPSGAASSGAAGTAMSTVPMSTVVDMTGREFEPHVRVVRVGGSVAYPNRDPFSHNVFSNSSLGAFDLGLYRSGVTRTATFSRAGVYPIYCNIHARMVNFVLALSTPHATQADRSGSFELKGIPAGVYQLRVWHERAPEAVTVTAAAPTLLTVSLDARRYVPAPHADKFGKPYAATRADRY